MRVEISRLVLQAMAIPERNLNNSLLRISSENFKGLEFQGVECKNTLYPQHEVQYFLENPNQVMET